MKILEMQCCSEEVLETVNFLLSQLSQTAERLTRDKLDRIISSDASKLLFAIDNGQVLGMLHF